MGLTISPMLEVWQERNMLGPFDPGIVHQVVTFSVTYCGSMYTNTFMYMFMSIHIYVCLFKKKIL